MASRLTLTCASRMPLLPKLHADVIRLHARQPVAPAPPARAGGRNRPGRAQGPGAPGRPRQPDGAGRACRREPGQGAPLPGQPGGRRLGRRRTAARSSTSWAPKPSASALAAMRQADPIRAARARAGAAARVAGGHLLRGRDGQQGRRPSCASRSPGCRSRSTCGWARCCRCCGRPPGRVFLACTDDARAAGDGRAGTGRGTADLRLPLGHGRPHRRAWRGGAGRRLRHGARTPTCAASAQSRRRCTTMAAGFAPC